MAASNSANSNLFIIKYHPLQRQDKNINMGDISSPPNILIPNKSKNDDPIPLSLSNINSFITSSRVSQPLKQELIRKLKKSQNYNSLIKDKVYIRGKKDRGPNPNINVRIPFTKEEDEKIKSLVNNIGTGEWTLISTFLNGRTAKQCRDRYFNYLKPGIFLGEWTIEEDEIITKMYLKHGPKWSLISTHIPNRTTNSIKNRWNFYLSRYVNENQQE